MKSALRGARKLFAVGQQCCGTTWQVRDRDKPTFLRFCSLLGGRDAGGEGGGGGGAGHRRFSIGSVVGVQMAENVCFCGKNRNVAAKR